MSIRSYTTAWAIAQILGAGHRACHAGILQDALTAHPAVEERYLACPFPRNEGALHPTAWQEPATEDA